LREHSFRTMGKSGIIGLLLVAVCLAVIVSMVGDFSQDATFKTAHTKPQKSFQVVGTLELQREMNYDAEKDANLFTFFVKDKEGEVRKVVFRGNKPPDFERSESVTLTGSMKGSEFHCTKILTKCPSKYTDNQEFTAQS
jgi:cytochrome c-type biogenesis protein CcmE